MSKTLKLIDHYYKVLREQDEQDVPMEQPDPSAAMPPEAPEMSQETVPLSSPAEIRYMEDVVLAALMEPPSGDDRITLENILDLLRNPDNIKKIQGSGQTAKDLYQNQVLPIIRPAQQGVEIRDNLNTIS